MKNFTLYGERSSGTNYLEELINNNFNITFTSEYGHKHFFGFCDFNSKDINILNDTLFLGIIRDPINWLYSLQKVQHHCPEFKTFERYLLDEFYSVDNNKNIIPEDLNYTNNKKYKNIFELRKLKNEYLMETMPKLVKNYFLFFYEDLCKDPFYWLEVIQKKFNLEKKFNIYKNIDYYQKKTNMPYVKKKYSYDDEILKLIFKNLDIKQEIKINKHFKSEYNKYINYMGNNYVFFHIYCNKNTFRVVCDMISKIIYSDLYADVDKIYTFLTGDIVYMEQCINYIINCGNKFDIAEIGIDDDTAERFTLLKMKYYLKDNDKFLYIHSKGVTRDIDHEMTNYINDWRYYMEYFLICKYKTCLKELDEYDTVGVNYLNHYSGNFWWSKGEYFKTLQDFIEDYYTAPEDYIFKSTQRKPKVKNLYSSGMEGFGHYHNGFPWAKFIDKI